MAAARPPDVHRIAVPAAAEGGPRNAWLVATPAACLVDPGPATPAAYAALRDALAAHGFSIRDVAVIVLTHAHGGHAGLAARLHAESGARVRAHPLALTALADPDAAVAARVDLARRAARAVGMPEALAAAALAAWQRSLTAELGPDPAPLPRAAGQPVADGEAALDAPGAPWTVHVAGGHAPDHIVVVDLARGLALTGDLIDRQHAVLPGLAPADADGRRRPRLAELHAGWRALARLPLSTWLPGHGGAIRAPRVLVARRLAAVRGELVAARQALTASPQTAWQLAERLGLATDAAGARRTLVAIVGIADWLVDRGWAQRGVEGGVWQLVRAVGRSSGRPPRAERGRPAQR